MGTVEGLIDHWCEGLEPIEDRLAVAATVAAMDRCTSEEELRVLGKRLALESDLSRLDRDALRGVYSQYQRIVRMRLFRARPAIALRPMGGSGKSGGTEFVQAIREACGITQNDAADSAASV